MYRVRYRFCPHEDKEFRMEDAAREQQKLHQGLYHHDDGRRCAVVEELLPGQAARKQGGPA